MAWSLLLALMLLRGTFGWEHGSVTTQGRRAYQEDRLLAVPDLKLSNTTSVGLFAVFDGHIGSQASQFLVANFEKQLRTNLEQKDVEQAEVLKTALEKTILELEDMFVKEAVKNRWPAGSTASVVLLTNEHIVLGHVGDSSVVACHAGPNDDPRLYEFKLTSDHHPLDPEEKERIERAGGVIYEGGLIDGHFPMSRAIGDVPMKRHGVIATPTVSSFPNFDDGMYLVVASDGLYEGDGVTVNSICEMASKVRRDFLNGEPGVTQAIAEKAVELASRRSRDNISVIVVSMK